MLTLCYQILLNSDFLETICCNSIFSCSTSHVWVGYKIPLIQAKLLIFEVIVEKTYNQSSARVVVFVSREILD